MYSLNLNVEFRENPTKCSFTFLWSANPEFRHTALGQMLNADSLLIIFHKKHLLNKPQNPSLVGP